MDEEQVKHYLERMHKQSEDLFKLVTIIWTGGVSTNDLEEISRILYGKISQNLSYKEFMTKVEPEIPNNFPYEKVYAKEIFAYSKFLLENQCFNDLPGLTPNCLDWRLEGFDKVIERSKKNSLKN